MRRFMRKLKTAVFPQKPLRTRKSFKMKVIMTGFYSLLVLVVVNAVVMTLYFNDNDYEYTIFSHSYIEAILPNQPTDGRLRTGIVRTTETPLSDMESGDYVVTYDEDGELLGAGEEFPLVSEILSVNGTDGTITITYDDVTSLTVPSEDMIGEYQREAGIIGTYYYTSMFQRGYTLLMFSHIILLSGYYFVFIYDNPDRFMPEKKTSGHSPKQ